MKPRVVLGLGNTLMTDEGVGVRVSQALQRRVDLPEDVEVLDLGSGGLRALHLMKDRQQAIFVDCAFMGQPPGEWRRFTPEQVRSEKVQTRLSMHESDLLQTIELSRQLEECPPEVVILGIEPETVEPGEALSESLASRVDEYADRILCELRES